jgi:hypothetical protein
MSAEPAVGSFRLMSCSSLGCMVWPERSRDSVTVLTPFKRWTRPLLTHQATGTRFAVVLFRSEMRDLQSCSHIGTRIHKVRHGYGSLNKSFAPECRPGSAREGERARIERSRIADSCQPDAISENEYARTKLQSRHEYHFCMWPRLVLEPLVAPNHICSSGQLSLDVNKTKPMGIMFSNDPRAETQT